VIYPSEYLGEPDDNELQLLVEYLISLKDAENVRRIEKRNWKNRISTAYNTRPIPLT
jgi:RNA polymerase II subunit A small phosphatase-like protein